MSLSSNDNNIKVWNVYNWDCLLNLKNVNTNGKIYSSCFLNVLDDNNYIVTSNYNSNNQTENIKIFDFNGNKTKEITDSNVGTYFIDNYYDKKLSKYFIITGNQKFIRSYDYNNNTLYHIYKDETSKSHFSIVRNDNEKNINLIESSSDGNIRIWNFHTAELLNRIRVGNGKLYGILLWNNDYLFVGCEDKTIEIIDIKKGIVIHSLIGHNNRVLSIKKINHPQYGECLISHSSDRIIKLWSYK